MTTIDYSHYDFDEDGNPEYVGPPREEPWCDQCSDRHTVRTGRLLQLIRVRERGCPSCNPSWITIHTAWLRPWRLRAAIRRLRHLFSKPVYTDEPPF